jgi:alkanesulfonate monooxygenase SsuD/methylene tetrahydromethanopterin reductase-like flavin-dependent oxidoreductase (luciferase family)
VTVGGRRYGCRVRVGISLTSSYPGLADADVAGLVVERARAAAAAGLATLSLGDHHSTGPVPYVQNVPMLARALAEWDERPAGCLFLVPQWNPVHMAEQIGTLASIAAGPFIVQTGLGGRAELAAMGIDVAHRGRRLEATVRVVQALLRGERVDDDELGIRGAAIAPRPARGVEWWIGAATEGALDRAARLGDGWYADAGLDPTRAADQLSTYLDACTRHGRQPGRTAVRKDVFIADDDAEARRVGTALIEAGYRGGMTAESVAFGDPAHVAEQLAVYAELGFTDVVVRTMATIPQPAALRSIELAGRVAELLASS